MRRSVGCDPREQVGQLPHIVKRDRRPGCAKRFIIARSAMAASVKAEDGHAGGKRAGNAGDAVLDHHASPRKCGHLRGREQEQIGCGFAVAHLRARKDIRCETRVETCS